MFKAGNDFPGKSSNSMDSNPSFVNDYLHRKQSSLNVEKLPRRG